MAPWACIIPKMYFKSINIFTFLPSVIAITQCKAINSAYCADVLLSKAWTSITWVKVTIAYPAAQLPFRTMVLPPAPVLGPG